MDSFAFLSNVLTSVLIVFVNKVLMDRGGEYKFVFGEHLKHFHGDSTARKPLAMRIQHYLRLVACK